MNCTAEMESVISVFAFGSTAVCFTLWNKRHNNRRALLDDQTRPSLKSFASSSSSIQSSMHIIQHLSAFSGWADYGDDEEAFIQDFPKVELHVVRDVKEWLHNMCSLFHDYSFTQPVSFSYYFAA